MQNLANRMASSAPPAPLPAAMERQLSGFRSALMNLGFQRFSISAEAAPTPSDRHWMAQRRADLAEFLGPSDRDKILMLLAPVFATVPSQGTSSEAGLKGKLQTYAAVLVDFPFWAVCEACGRIHKGTAAGVNPDWLPTPARFTTLVLAIVNPWADQRADLEKILSAKIADPPARSADVNAKFLDLYAGLDPAGESNRRDARLARNPQQFSAFQQHHLAELERRKTNYLANAPVIGPSLNAGLRNG